MDQAHFKPWTESEIAILKEMSGKFKAAEISEKVGRGVHGVQKMARKLGLPVYSQPRKEVPVPKPRKPVAPPVKVKTYLEPKSGLRQPPKPKASVSYPTTELCPVHRCLVSNWPEHVMRLGNTCARPAL